MSKFVKKALIKDITGKDGKYLAEFILKKESEVHRLKRSSRSFNKVRIDHLYREPNLNNQKYILEYGDLTDTTNLKRIIKKLSHEEIYNLEDQADLSMIFESSNYTFNSNVFGILRIFEARRILGIK